MPQVINTNIASLNTQRHLNSSQSAQSTSLERLSSGLRINSAKDDAAGLAISERMTSQVRGLNQATRNANDGVSLAQTAEGALGEIGNNLQRIRELAVQSRNATNSATDRAALDTEAQALKSEIDRIADTTSFNGVKLLDGSFANQDFQVGANVGDTISVTGITDANAVELGSYNVVEHTVTVAAATGVNTGSEEFTLAFDDGSGSQNLTFNINQSTTDTVNAQNLADEVNKLSAQTGVYASVSGADLTLNSATATAFSLTEGTDETDAVLPTVTGATAAKTGFSSLDLKTVQGADEAILQMDAALTEVNTTRAQLGAVQSRFDSVIANNQTTSENLSAARSRIQDTDFAMESAQLSRSQVLQQAGTAMLGQANQLPQNVLGLLR